MNWLLTDANQDASLQQNFPNPFTTSTVIRCNVSWTFKTALAKVITATGVEVLSFPIQQPRMSEFTIQSGSLAAGIYKYTLIVDGKMIDAKKMVLTK